MLRRDRLSKGKSRLLYSSRQHWHDTCVVVLDEYYLVVATSGFTQIGIRGEQPVG